MLTYQTENRTQEENERRKKKRNQDNETEKEEITMASLRKVPPRTIAFTPPNVQNRPHVD
jgi:hypothetical protein